MANSQLEKGRDGKLPSPPEGWTYEFDDSNTANDWLAYINIYLGRAVQTSAAGVDHHEQFRDNMVKVATLACAAIEAVDRNSGLPPRHYDA